MKKNMIKFSESLKIDKMVALKAKLSFTKAGIKRWDQFYIEEVKYNIGNSYVLFVIISIKTGATDAVYVDLGTKISDEHDIIALLSENLLYSPVKDFNDYGCNGLNDIIINYKKFLKKIKKKSEKKNKVPKTLLGSLDKKMTKCAKVFAKKHDLYFDFWVSDIVGYVACFSDQFYFDFETIKLDLEKGVPKDIIFVWYDAELSRHFDGKSETSYYNYLKQKQNSPK